MSNNNKPFFIRLFFFCSLIALAFSFLPLYAQSPYDSKDTDSLFEACEAIIDKSLDNVIKDLVGIKAENKDLKNTLEEYRKLLEESSPDKVKDLQTEIRKLQEKVEGYKTSLTESLSRVETETNKNDKLQNAIKNLNDQISALKIEYNTLLENNASLKEIQHTQEETIDRLQVEVTQLEDTLGEKEESLRGLKDRPSLPPKQDIEPLQKEIQRYRSLLQEKETKADYYQDQLRQKEKAIADLTGELQTLEDRYQALIDSNQSSQTKGTQDQQIIAGLKGELLRIKERLSEKEALLAQAEQELSRFTSETKGAQSALQEDIERYKSLLSAKESELAQYTGDLKGANSALKEERRRFNELVKKLETIQEELASLTTQNKQLQEENNKMRSDRTAQLKEIDNLKKTITQLEDSLGEKKQEIAKKTSQAQEEKTLTSQQERQIVQYENQLRKKEQELGAAEKMIAQLTQSKEALATERNELKTTLAELQSSTQVQTKGLDSLNQTIAGLKTQIAQYENQLRKKEQELGAAEKMIAQLTQSKEALVTEHNELKTTLAELQSSTQVQTKDLDSLNQTIADLKTQIAQKESAIETLNKTLRQSTKEKEDILQSQRQEIQGLNRQITLLQAQSKANCAQEIQSLQAANQKDTDTINQLKRELQKAESEKTNALTKIDALTQELDSVRADRDSSLQKARQQTEELHNQIVSLQGEQTALKTQHARDMQTRQNRIDELEKESEAKNNLIASLQSKLDQYAQIVPEGQLRTQEKIYLKTKKLKGTINEYKDAYEQSQAELNDLERTYSQSAGKINDLQKKIKSLEQENLDLLKEAEALNKTIYSLGLGSELQRTKELTATRQERQEKQYARELKEYAAQVNDLRQTIGRYEVAVAELLTLLDTIEITDPRNTRQIHDLKKTLHTLQSNTW